jgi:hypothetical protein
VGSWDHCAQTAAIRQLVEISIGVRTCLKYGTWGKFYCAALASTREVTGQARPGVTV